METPITVDLKFFTDDRGNIRQTFDEKTYEEVFHKVKRIYEIDNGAGVCRAYHGHLNESKIIIVKKGRFKFVGIPIIKNDDGNILPINQKNFDKMKELMVSFFIDGKSHKAVFFPAGWYNGYISYNEGELYVLSDSSLEESKNDDFRLSYDLFGKEVWEVKNR